MGYLLKVVNRLTRQPSTFHQTAEMQVCLPLTLWWRMVAVWFCWTGGGEFQARQLHGRGGWRSYVAKATLPKTTKKRTWKQAVCTKMETIVFQLPTIDFQVRTVSFREGWRSYSIIIICKYHQYAACKRLLRIILGWVESTGDALHILRASNMNMNRNTVYGILPLNHSLLGHPDLNERRIYGVFFLKRETHPLETEKLLNQMYFLTYKDYYFSKGLFHQQFPWQFNPGIFLLRWTFWGIIFQGLDHFFFRRQPWCFVVCSHGKENTGDSYRSFWVAPPKSLHRWLRYICISIIKKHTHAQDFYTIYMVWVFNSVQTKGLGFESWSFFPVLHRHLHMADG